MVRPVLTALKVLGAPPIKSSLSQALAATNLSIVILFFCLIFFWGGAHAQHMEGPRLGAESDLQLPAYTTATATPYP